MSKKMKIFLRTLMTLSVILVITGTAIIISSLGLDSKSAVSENSSSLESAAQSVGSTSKADTVNNDETDDIVHATGKSYYVDAVDGNDKNDGRSTEKAFLTLKKINELVLKPGDRVLLKKGCAWNSSLRPKGNGSKANPIVIGMYGQSGMKPLINGNGEVRATIDVININYIEIRNLEVTNFSGKDTDYLTAISVVGRDRIVSGITVKNCYVHDVDSTNTRTSSMDPHWYGGIVVKGEYYTSKVAGVQDVLVENNVVKNLNPTAIVVNAGSLAKNVVIRNNYVSNIGGDGIILIGTKGGIVEHNTSANCGQNGTGNPYVGIWTMSSDDALIQYNESYGNKATADGEGFDVDNQCHNVIVQYNYSHDNYGGFILFNCLFGYSNTTVRYNISQNDGRCIFAYYLDGKTKGFLSNVYNNTIYTTSVLEKVMVTTNYTPAMENIGTYRNNIFYIQNSIPSTYYDLVEGSLTFEGNCFYGDKIRHEPEDAKKIIGNPLFAAFGTGKTGLDTTFGYKLQSGSSCIGTGVAITNGAAKDFWGNLVTPDKSPNIGAYNGSAVSVPKTVNIAAFKSVKASGYNIAKYENKLSYALMATDEKKDTYISTESKTKSEEEWVEVDFQSSYTIEKVVLTSASKYFPVEYKISLYNGKDWQDVSTQELLNQPGAGEDISISFAPVKGIKLRITATKLRESDPGKFRMDLAEIKAYQ